MGLSIWHLLIIAFLIILLFGRGRISEMMGDFGKGVSSFKKSVSSDDEAAATKPVQQLPYEKPIATEVKTPADPEPRP